MHEKAVDVILDMSCNFTSVLHQINSKNRKDIVEMIIRRVFLSLFAVTVISPVTAQAQNFDFSGNVALTTSYSFRGITQSDEDPALQGGFDVSHDTGLYAGIWGSNVDFDDGDEAQLETDIYGGYSGSLKNFNYDVGLIHYAYPGADDSLDYDFTEASAALGYDFEHFSSSVSLNYSPEYFGDSGDAYYYAASVDVPLPKNFGLSGHFGHQDIEDNTAFDAPDYNDWSAGVNYTVQKFDFSLRYVDTDLDQPEDCSDGCDSRAIFSISRSF